MSKRKFLVPVAATLAALTQNANALPTQGPAVSAPDLSTATTPQTVSRLPGAGESTEMLLPVNDGLFKFVLRRGENGVMVADHYSHSSHASHGSHRSHYSSS